MQPCIDAVQRILGVLLMVFSADHAAAGAAVAGRPVTARSSPSSSASAVAARHRLRPVAAGAQAPPGAAHPRRLLHRGHVLGGTRAWPARCRFLLRRPHRHRLVDAVFETISGLTTTGATVITGIDELPLSIRYYRQQLQWLGGMGIIVLAVAILPMLGIGGMQLYRAEMPGPVKDAKLTPRIAETAKALWYIYLGLTVACALAYWLAGMSAFDAIAHSFSTVATGGFSTYDASIGHFDSPVIEMIAVVSSCSPPAMNYLPALHWSGAGAVPTPWVQRPGTALLRGHGGHRALVLITGGLVSRTRRCPGSDAAGGRGTTASSRWSSFATTTGLHHRCTMHVLAGVPAGAAAVPRASSVAAASSTSGGMKAIRVLLLLKQGRREILRLIHPQAVLPVKLGDRAGARAGHRCRVGLLRCLRGAVHGDHAEPYGHGAGPGHGLLRHRLGHEQPRSRPWGCGDPFRPPSATAPSC
ncbi:MAG: potassium transporter TrkG [Arhodomonas sp.]|nr:potassium transporter TrkG [Arhodomonas sp.]